MTYARGALRLLGIGVIAMVLAGLLLRLTHAPDDWRAYAGLALVGAWLAYRARTAR